MDLRQLISSFNLLKSLIVVRFLTEADLPSPCTINPESYRGGKTKGFMVMLATNKDILNHNN